MVDEEEDEDADLLVEEDPPGRQLAEAQKPKRKFCNTSAYSLKGDYAYEACGAFCKSTKAENHCKFCKCKACSFCPASGAAAAPTTAVTKGKKGGGLLKKGGGKGLGGKGLGGKGGGKGLGGKGL